MIAIIIRKQLKESENMRKQVICEQCHQPIRRLKHSILCRCGTKIIQHK